MRLKVGWFEFVQKQATPNAVNIIHKERVGDTIAYVGRFGCFASLLRRVGIIVSRRQSFPNGFRRDQSYKVGKISLWHKTGGS